MNRLLAYLARAAARKLLRFNRLTVVRAPVLDIDLPPPDGARLIRVSALATAEDIRLARIAMGDALEDPAAVDLRLREGDLFLGWMVDARVTAFCWIRFRNRHVGPVLMLDAPGRAFMYNAVTLAEFRRLGHFEKLALTIRRVLALQGITEIIADVNVTNAPSRRVLLKAGYEAVGTLSYWTFLTRWRCLARKHSCRKSTMAAW